MAAKITNPGTQTFEGEREHQSFRLAPQIIAVIEDIAMGVEAGESGLKSCTLGAMSAASLGASANQVAMQHAKELVELDDIDDYLDAVGDMLAKDFSHEEIAETVELWCDDVHMSAIERWCDRIKLSYRTKTKPSRWGGTAAHDRRRRGQRAMAKLQAGPNGHQHAATLHIVYGWADPFVKTLPIEVVAAMGRELAPLARYTDAVETRRKAMAWTEAAHIEANPGWAEPTKDPGRAWRGVDMSVDEIRRYAGDDRVQHGSEAARAAISLGLDATAKNAGVVDLARRRSRLEWADRNLTSGDALRSGAAPFNEPNHPKHEYESVAAFESRRVARDERKRRHNDATSAFLLAVKLEANRMLTTASEEFKAAWLASWRS